MSGTGGEQGPRRGASIAIEQDEPAITGAPTTRRASLSLDDERAALRAGAGLVMDDGAPDATDGRVASGPTASPVDDRFARIALPPFKYEEAARIHKGELSTASALGLSGEMLAAMRDAPPPASAWSGQVRRLLEKIDDAVDLDANQFGTADQKIPGFGRWLATLKKLAGAGDAGVKLLALFETERVRGIEFEVFDLIRRSLDDDGKISTAEDDLIFGLVKLRGLDAAALERYYQAFRDRNKLACIVEPGARGRVAAGRSGGWVRHEAFGEEEDWDRDLMVDALMGDFPSAVRIANSSGADSLVAYLRVNDKEAHKQLAYGVSLAKDLESPPLAVWYLLWSTGRRELPLATGFRPDPLLAVASPAELLARAEQEDLLDAIGRAIDGGLFEHWLASHAVAPEIVKFAANLRDSAHGVVEKERPDSLRIAALRMLWSLGLAGLPLMVGGRTKMIRTVDDLFAAYPEQWDALLWSLEHGVLGDWLATIDASKAEFARDAEPARRKKTPLDLAVWTFLWRAGSRDLHLSRTVAPTRRDVRVPNVEALIGELDSSDAKRSGASARAMKRLLENHYLVSWLTHGAGRPDLATAVERILGDDRGLKERRVGQTLGSKVYRIGGISVDSVADFAQLPLQLEETTELWEHIREGLVQARFHDDPAVVKVLEAVRADAALKDTHRPLIACLRLGLKVLPYRGPRGAGRLERFTDLGDLLDQEDGRSILDPLLRAHILEAWADALEPGAGARVRAALDEPPHLAADEAARSLHPSGVHTVPGRRAVSFSALDFKDLKTSAARDRVRRAVFGPHRLAGVPEGLTDYTEAELESASEPARPMLFAWAALGKPEFPLGTQVVRSVPEFLAVIADPAARREAQGLAAFGLVSFWLQAAQKQELPSGLGQKVGEQDFPALCLELGEAPPTLEVKWSSQYAQSAEGGTVDFEGSVTNLDPVRAVRVKVEISASHTVKTRYPRDLFLAPSETVPLSATLYLADGCSGIGNVAVELRHYSPDRELETVATSHLSVKINFPWSLLLVPIIACAVLGTLSMLGLRAIASPILEKVAGDPKWFAIIGWLLGLTFLTVERVLVYAVKDGFWLHDKLKDGSEARVRASWLAFMVLGTYQGCQDGFLTGLAMMLQYGVCGFLFFAIALRDWIAALILALTMSFASPLGALVVGTISALDHTFGSVGGLFGLDALGHAVAAWALFGTLFGLATGLAAGFRRISRDAIGELSRLGMIAAIAVLYLLGRP